MLGMLIGNVVKNSVKKAIKKSIVKKLDKVTQYVEEPNELDVQMKQALKTISKQGRYIEECQKDNAILKKDIAILQRDSHPSQEYICCRKCGCEIAKTKNK